MEIWLYWVNHGWVNYRHVVEHSRGACKLFILLEIMSILMTLIYSACYPDIDIGFRGYTIILIIKAPGFSAEHVKIFARFLLWGIVAHGSIYNKLEINYIIIATLR